MTIENTHAPEERDITIRNQITELLKDRELSTIEISKIVRIPEKSVWTHLDHIRKSIQTKGYTFKIIPAECLNCGFVFKKRDKVKTPTRCPICKSEHIRESLFKIEKK